MCRSPAKTQKKKKEKERRRFNLNLNFPQLPPRQPHEGLVEVVAERGGVPLGGVVAGDHHGEALLIKNKYFLLGFRLEVSGEVAYFLNIFVHFIFFFSIIPG